MTPNTLVSKILQQFISANPTYYDPYYDPKILPNMKKKFYLTVTFISTFIFCGCNDSVEQDLQCENLLGTYEKIDPYEVTQSEALEKAINHFNLPTVNCADVKNRSNSNVKRTLAETVRLNDKMETRSSSETPTNGCYLFNFADNMGYAIVSADKRDSVGIYIASESGNIPTEIIEDQSTEMGYLMSLVKNYQDYKVNTYVEPFMARYDDNYEYVITDTVYYDVQLLDTQWRQDTLFNSTKPGYMMGCVPVALGQIMAYHQHPDYPITVGGVVYNFDWDLISMIKTRYDALYNNNAAFAVSNLLLAIGIQADADYGTGSTGVYGNRVIPTLNHFGYLCSAYSEYNYSTICNEILTHRRPLYICGTDPDANKGHAWIITGVKSVRHEEVAYRSSTGEQMENTILEQFNTLEYIKYVYLNCGWGDPDTIYTVLYNDESYLYERTSVFSGVFSIGGLNFSDIQIISGIRPNE